MIDVRGSSTFDASGTLLDEGTTPAGYFSGAAGLLGLDIWSEPVANLFRLEEAEYSESGSGSLVWVQIGIGPHSPPFSTLGLGMYGVAATIRAHAGWTVEGYWLQIPPELATDSETVIRHAQEAFSSVRTTTQIVSVSLDLWAHPNLVLNAEGLVGQLQYYVGPEGPVVRVEAAMESSGFHPHEENLWWSQNLVCKVHVRFEVTLWSPELAAWLSQVMILVARGNMVGCKEILVGVSLLP